MNSDAAVHIPMMIYIQELHLCVAGLDLLPPGLSLSVGRGERVGVTGPSGCGKTTLLRSIAARAFPDGAQCRAFTVSTERVGYAPQRSGLFPWLTLGRNLEFFSARAGDRSVDEAALLEVVGLTGRRSHFPGEMSGGEAQRAILACALAAGPELLLIDEPLTGVDSTTKWRILSWLSAHILQREMTLMVVSHDLDVLSFLTDTVLIFSNERSRAPVRIGDATPHPREWADAGAGSIASYRNQIMRNVMAQAQA